MSLQAEEASIYQVYGKVHEALLNLPPSSHQVSATAGLGPFSAAITEHLD